MGLDMYIAKAKKNSDNKWELADDFELLYWRKANQIRQWFVTNLGYNENANCEFFPLEKENIESLIEDIDNVLNAENKELMAKRVLPTSSGFFFGNTEYGEWYYDELEFTKNELEKLLDMWDDIINDSYTIGYYEWW